MSEITFEFEEIKECDILNLRSIQLMRSFAHLSGYLHASGIGKDYDALMIETRKMINKMINEELNTLIQSKMKKI